MPGARKLGRTTDHRKAMLRAMVTYLLENGKIETTVTRAKEVRSMAEKIITIGKNDSLHVNVRYILSLRKRPWRKKYSMKFLPNIKRETAVTPASSKSDLAAVTLLKWRLSSWYNEINTQTDAETCIRFFFAIRSFILHKSKSKRFRNPNQKGLQTKTAVLCKKGVDI